ncbi:transporter [Bacillus pseudomycoides]|nr:transporter [Bacillus pseudomycoides]
MFISKCKHNKGIVWIFKASITVALWVWLLPVILNPSNVPFRVLLNVFSDDLAGTLFNFILFSFVYVIYFILVVFMSYKVIWTDTSELRNR